MGFHVPLEQCRPAAHVHCTHEPVGAPRDECINCDGWLVGDPLSKVRRGIEQQRHVARPTHNELGICNRHIRRGWFDGGEAERRGEGDAIAARLAVQLDGPTRRRQALSTTTACTGRLLLLVEDETLRSEAGGGLVVDAIECERRVEDARAVET